ncbi:hypothetical protein D9M69_671130 [compost metagenome]
MAEQFTFHQGFGKRTAVDGNKGLTPPAAQVVNMPCDQLLTGSGFTNDQRIGFTRGQALDAAEQLLGSRVLEHQDGGPHRFGQFASVWMSNQRHGAFLAVKARAQ